MKGSDKVGAADHVTATVILGASDTEQSALRGHFSVECVGVGGAVKWIEEFDNLVVTVGKNLALDTFLAGAGYTVTGPYMGLISSVGWSAVAAGDAMSSHAGWTEAGLANAPTYTAPRKTCVFSAAAAGAKALSASLAFAITGVGTLKGAFIVFGTGAVATIDNTSGILLSAGTFAAGDRAVINGDTVNANYSLTLT